MLTALTKFKFFKGTWLDYWSYDPDKDKMMGTVGFHVRNYVHGVKAVFFVYKPNKFVVVYWNKNFNKDIRMK